MARLILKTGPKTGLEYTLSGGAVLGRKLEVTIHVNDVKASREHAKIVAEGDRFHLVDLNSTNGTYLNGERIVRNLLSHGDRIRIGQTEFEYHDPAAAPPAAPSKNQAAPAPAPAQKKYDIAGVKPKKVNVTLTPKKRRR